MGIGWVDWMGSISALCSHASEYVCNSSGTLGGATGSNGVGCVGAMTTGAGAGAAAESGIDAGVISTHLYPPLYPFPFPPALPPISWK